MSGIGHGFGVVRERVEVDLLRSRGSLGVGVHGRTSFGTA